MLSHNKRRKSFIIGILGAIVLISLFSARSLFGENHQIGRYLDGWYLVGEVLLILIATYLIEKKIGNR